MDLITYIKRNELKKDLKEINERGYQYFEEKNYFFKNEKLYP